MKNPIIHRFGADMDLSSAPEEWTGAYLMPPHPMAQAAAQDTTEAIHAYMADHPQSELHKRGKMFGVLVIRDPDGGYGYLRAYSAMLDGETTMDGFVGPVFKGDRLPEGHTREQSRRLQKLFFAEQYLLNNRGERRSILDIFRNEKPIIEPDEWFRRERQKAPMKSEHLPPSGAGECCAPKMLQCALENGWQPLALAEFWVGAKPQNELRREGVFYAPCSSRCRPILRWMIGEDSAHRSYEEAQEIPVLYEDEWILVVNKPSGILSVPGTGDEPFVARMLQREAEPVHRLDQDTSGLLVMAKNAEVYTGLQRYFQRRDILKRYEAVLDSNHGGAAIPEEGDISLPLLPNPMDRPRQMVDKEHGKIAETHFRVRERRTDGSVLIDFYPRTGRTHQLRVHAAHPEGLDTPIKGDRLYGTPADRLYLHAAEIRFVHPVTGEEMHFCIESGF